VLKPKLGELNAFIWARRLSKWMAAPLSNRCNRTRRRRRAPVCCPVIPFNLHRSII
jgi:hypothetical protein